MGNSMQNARDFTSFIYWPKYFARIKYFRIKTTIGMCSAIAVECEAHWIAQYQKYLLVKSWLWQTQAVYWDHKNPIGARFASSTKAVGRPTNQLRHTQKNPTKQRSLNSKILSFNLFCGPFLGSILFHQSILVFVILLLQLYVYQK